MSAASELQDMLVRVEAAMQHEGIEGWKISHVINTLIYGEPNGPSARYSSDEQRTLRLRQALAQAKAHERAMDQLQSELRAAGEAYAYIAALAVRDSAMDLVQQLRDDLGDKDPDVIPGEAMLQELERYHHAAAAAHASVTDYFDQALPESPLKEALIGVADVLWPAWTPFRRPIPGVTSSYRQRPMLPEGCYDASFGRVHIRPGCHC